MPRRVIAAIVATCALAGVIPAAAQFPLPPPPPPLPPPPAPAVASATTRLAETREDLRISELTLARIQRDLDALRQKPDADPGVLRDYSIYLEKVRAMMLAHQRNAMEMESLQARVTPSSPMAPWRRVEPAVFDPPVPITFEDELALLDAELDDTLAAFDAFLLEQQYEAARRMEQLDDASSAEMTALAREAAAAVERLREKGIDIDTTCSGDGGGGGAPPGGSESAAGPEGTGSGAPGSTTQPAGAEPGEPGAPGEGQPDDPALPPTGEGGSDTGTASGSGAGGSGTGGAGTGTPEGTPGPGSPASGGTGEPRPGDRPPAADDDIVARQLREAAERETDPELREKLWREYDKYKGSR